MSWKQRVPEWAHTPWTDEYYPGQSDSFPWLINNDSADWTPRS